MDKNINEFIGKYSEAQKGVVRYMQKENPLFLPQGTIRDITVVLMVFTLCLLVYKGIFFYWTTNASLAEKIFLLFSQTLTGVLGYYYGNREKQKTP